MRGDKLTWILMRAKHQATPWIAYLEQNKMDYEFLPLLEIVPTDSVDSEKLVRDLEKADYIIMTSANGVYFASTHLIAALKAAQHKIVTMGQGTSEALRAHQIHPFYTAQDGMTSEWLLKDPLFDESVVRGKSILLWGGAGGRTYLMNHLSQRRAVVTKVALYQRTRVEWPPMQKEKYFFALRAKTPIFVLTSQEMLEALLAFAPIPYHAWLKDQWFITISQRIYHYAFSQGFKKIENVNSMQIQNIHHFVAQKQLT